MKGQRIGKKVHRNNEQVKERKPNGVSLFFSAQKLNSSIHVRMIEKKERKGKVSVRKTHLFFLINYQRQKVRFIFRQEKKRRQARSLYVLLDRISSMKMLLIELNPSRE